MHPVAKQLTVLEDELNNSFFERSHAIRACLLALLSGQHIFILGTPGTAKTQLVRAIMKAIIGARVYYTALSKNKPANFVTGPLNLKRLREDNELVIKREGYATDVELAMFDEVGKMSAILGHDLLPLFNERMYHEVSEGNSEHPAPLSTAFCPSNEMIEDESDDAAAMWSRLLIRVVVERIKDRANFARMVFAPKLDIQTTIEWVDLKHAIDVEVPAIEFSESAARAFLNLRETFNASSLSVDDRKWRWSHPVLKANAFLAGRTQVEEVDLAVLQDILWDTLEQRDHVSQLCISASSPFAERCYELRGLLGEVNCELALREVMDMDDVNRRSYGPKALENLKAVRTELDLMLMEAGDAKIPGFKIVSDMHKNTLARMYVNLLGNPADFVETTMFTSKLGSGDGGNF